MVKFLPLLLFLFSFTPALGMEKNSVLVVTAAWPPYVYQENKSPTGFDYEIMMSVFSKMGMGVDFQFLPWKRCVHMVETRQADAVLDISENENRRRLMYFPEETISESSSVLFHVKGKSYTFNNLKDLSGLTIGTILGYKYNKDFLDADYFTREEVGTEEQNFNKLMNNHIDLLLTNRNVGLFTAKKMGLLDKIDYLPRPVSGGSNYVAFAKKDGYEKLAEEFSSTLKAFKLTDEYRGILKKYGQR